MSENISVAIDALLDNKPNEFKDSIAKELGARINDRIDTMRSAAAASLFGTSNEEESTDENI